MYGILFVNLSTSLWCFCPRKFVSNDDLDTSPLTFYIIFTYQTKANKSDCSGLTNWLFLQHYSDVIMGAIVYSTVYSDADQRKHQSYASLAFVREIHRGPVNSPRKWPVTQKVFPFDDVITSVWGRGWTTSIFLSVQNLSTALPARVCHALQRVIGRELSCTCIVTSWSQRRRPKHGGLAVHWGRLVMLTEENLPSKYNVNEMKSMYIQKWRPTDFWQIRFFLK